MTFVGHSGDIGLPLKLHSGYIEVTFRLHSIQIDMLSPYNIFYSNFFCTLKIILTHSDHLAWLSSTTLNCLGWLNSATLRYFSLGDH